MGKISLSNIIEELATKSGLSREASDNFMHAFVEAIEKGLREDSIVKIKGLGTFKLQEVNDRGSVDVNTGERIIIKGYRRVVFTPDSVMKEFINRPFAHFEPVELNDGYPIEEETAEPDNSSDENEEQEMTVVEESVEETVAEVTAKVVDSPVPEVVEETVEKNEDIAEETVVAEDKEDVVTIPDVGDEETGEEVAESMEPTEQSALVTEEVLQPKPTRKKHRGGCLWLILLLLIAFVVYFLCTHVITFDEPVSTTEVDEQVDIAVNPNLKEELSAEFGDEPKADSVEEVQPKATEIPESQAIEPTKPTITTTTTTTPIFYEVKLTESLASKPLKEITLADTTDYTIEGTLVTHELKSGETIIQLARMYYGEKRLWPYIVKHNQMKEYNNLAIGQKINIPILK